jgi:hypothetical protein
MAYTNTEGREKLLDALTEATDEIGASLASLGAAYEQVDDQTADRLEEQLFGPVQRAYGRAKQAHAGFAARHDLPVRTFAPPADPPASRKARELIEDADAMAFRADESLVALQDEQALVEVGDVELRAAVAGVREALGVVPQRIEALLNTLGR